MTDNKNRTIGEIRTIFGKNGGNVGENGCVGWMFEQKGLITVPVEDRSEEELLELVMEAGGDDLKIEGDMYEIISSIENFESVRKALEEANVKIDTAELTRIPQNTVSLDESQAKQILRLMDLLDDHDDVQKAYSNFEISDEIMAALIEES